MRTASEIAAELIKEAEGFESAPYLCPAKVPSIGYGFTRYADGERVTMNDAPMSRYAADKYLAQQIDREIAIVQRLAPGVTGPRLAALVDFTFNLGTEAFRTSTLLKRVQADDWSGACRELPRWVYGGKPPKILPGLVTRRAREIAVIRGTL